MLGIELDSIEGFGDGLVELSQNFMITPIV